jgi:hypothetical protein
VNGEGAASYSEEDRRIFAARRMRFELEGLAHLKPTELAGIERCRRMFEAMGPKPETGLKPSAFVRGGMEVVFAPHAGEIARPLGAKSLGGVVGADFIGPRRRGCIQRDENGEAVMDMEGARTPWPTGVREPAERRQAPAAPAAGGV